MFNRTAILAVVACLSASRAHAQSSTPASLRSGHHVRPTISLDVGMGSIRGASAVFPGFDFGLQLSQRFTLGIAGTALANRSLTVPAAAGTGSDTVQFGYGGLRIGYTAPFTREVGISVSLLAGAGRAWVEGPDADADDEISEGLFVLEPSVMLELGLRRRIGLAVGASYRHVGHVGQPGLTSADLRGAVLRLALVGRFR